MPRISARRTLPVAMLGGCLLAFAPPGNDTVLAQGITQEVPADFTAIVERMSPAVVAITTRRLVEQGRAGMTPDQIPPQLREFFGRQMPGQQAPQQRQARAMGSGFLISEEGHIVTNNHVIDGAEEIQVVLEDGEPVSAELVGADPATDIAVLRIEPQEDMVVASWGDSEELQPGAWTIAIGSPFGLGGTVTVGVLSATSRDIRTGPYDDYLQTDASINQGNSGGPLFNVSGEVIGVNTAIFSPTGANIGIGFAVPSRTAQNVVSELIETGQVRRGFVGLSLQDLTPELARAMGAEGEEGAIVASVVPGGPAEAAGVMTGDIVQSIAGEPVTGSRELSRLVAAKQPGEEVPLVVSRAGEDVELSVEIGMRDAPEAAATGAVTPQDADQPRLGLSLSPLPEVLRRELDLEGTPGGLVVQRVVPGEPAAEAGLINGDVIIEANSRPVEEPADVSEAWKTAREEERPLLLRILRNGNPLFAAVEPAG